MWLRAELNRGPEIQPVSVVVSFQQSGLHMGGDGRGGEQGSEPRTEGETGAGGQA